MSLGILVMEELKTSSEWLETEKFNEYIVLDPDGWDRKNLEESWNELITEQEMFKRIINSTCAIKSDKINL